MSGAVQARSRRTERVVLRLIMAFDSALSAFNNDAVPGWPAASEELREALTAATAIGDVSTLPCPLSWWTACQASVRAWLEAEPDVRRGLSKAVHENIRALHRYARHAIAEPIGPHGAGVR